MKQIDHLDSLQHFNFPMSSNEEKRKKFGSFLLAIVGILGLFAMSSPAFQYSNSDVKENEKVNKFWLTPSNLNAEQTAFNTSLIQNSKAGQELFVADNAVTAKALN